MMSFSCPQKDVVLKTPLFDSAIWKGHLAISMLNALLPLSLIYRAICPEHFTIPISLIFYIGSFVHIATFPSEHTIPILPVILVLSIVLIAWVDINLLLPFTFAVLEALFELAHIDTA